MTTTDELRAQMRLPAICAPMFLVSAPRLVIEACKAGVMACLPRHNARSIEEFEGWLRQVRSELDAHRAAHPGARIGPLIGNLGFRDPPDVERANLDLYRRYGVEIIVSAAGDPAERVKRVHDWGGRLWHDCTSLRFAEKAAQAGADGIIAIGAGGGGHSGTVNHLALVAKVREFFDGTLVMAGAVSTGAHIRAAEVLGADFAYLGTRFIATQEAAVPDEYKHMLVQARATDLRYTTLGTPVPGNWLLPSLRRVGLDPDHLPATTGTMGGRYEQFAEHQRPWKQVWSAGQGVEQIQDIPAVHELVLRLRREYVAACDRPSMIDAARLIDEAGGA